MSFKPNRKYFPELLIQTRDTDPDLRFMALNDLEKELISSTLSISYADLIAYSQTILKCLDDEFSEVRTQSLKCFETIGSKLKMDVLNLVNELTNRNTKPKKIAITSTIYTMALHNLLKNLPQIEEVYVGIIDIIVPNILSKKDAFFTEIDYIEILSDVCEFMGKYLSNQNTLNVLLFLIDAIFNADTMIAKKSIVTCNILLQYVTEETIIDAYLKHMMSNFNVHSGQHEAQIKLLSALSGSIDGNPESFQKQASFFWDIATNCLQLTQLDKIEDDYEEQQNKDMIRIEAVTLLTQLFNCCSGQTVESLVGNAINICERVVVYDPYGDNAVDNDDDDDNDTDDENHYSDEDDDDDYDYDQDDDDDGDNNCSWKLRAGGLTLATTIVNKFPAKLPLVFDKLLDMLLNNILLEKHKIVVSRIMEFLSEVFNLSSETGAFYNSLRSKELIASVENRNVEEMDENTQEDPYANIACNSYRISGTLLQFIQSSPEFVNDKPDLILSLISSWVGTIGHIDDFAEKFVVSINETWRTQMMNIDLFTFYTTLLQQNTLADFGSGLQYLEVYLKKCLSDASNHRLIIESLSLLLTIFDSKDSNQCVLQMATSFSPVLIKRALNRNVSTEIRLQCLNVLVSMILNIKLDASITDEVLSIFNETLKTEVLAFNSLNFIVKIIEAKDTLQVVSSSWVKNIIPSCLEYINISDLSLNAIKALSALVSTDLIVEEDCSGPLIAIGKLYRDEKINSGNCIYVGTILMHVMNQVRVVDDLEFLTKLLVSLSAFDEFDELLPNLMTNILKQINIESLSAAIQNIDSGSPKLVQSKLLGVLSVASGNVNMIRSVLDKLANNEDIYFSLTFLNQVSKSIDIQIGLSSLIAGFGNEDPAIIDVTTKLIATMVCKYPDTYLPQFIQLFINCEHEIPFLRALSGILKEVEMKPEISSELLDSIINLLGRCDQSSKELEKAAAPCIGYLVIQYNLMDHILGVLSKVDDLSESVLIAISESNKTIFAHSDKISYIDDVSILQFAQLTTTNLIFSPQLRLKEVGISNLNLILAKMPSIAIPIINENIQQLIETEVKPNKEFIRTQMIGPYKHKIDDGLNYRKEIFELLYYSLKTVEDDKSYLPLLRFSWTPHFNKFFDAGIKDEQSIASVCLLTTLKIFEENNSLFVNINSEIDVFELFVTRCKKILNKKLSDTAVKQDLEKQANTVKMVVRFLKKVNDMISSSALNLTNTQKIAWNEFINDIRMRLPVHLDED